MHIPVFLDEVLEIFNPRPGQTYVDATANGGGHTRAIADLVGNTGRVISIDLDPGLVRELRETNRLEGRSNIEVVHGSYAELDLILERQGYSEVDGILFDLGFSSYHIDRSGRGFSFRADEPLDMRYDPSCNEDTAEQIVNNWSEQAIEDILRAHGEERYSRRIAAHIVAERKKRRIRTTADLVRIIRESVPGRTLSIHPATRTFQALRIAVNRELENIPKGMQAALGRLRQGGKIIAISFHSLEDREVKKFFQEAKKQGFLELIIAKPLKPSLREIRANPKARSAKLRAAVKIDQPHIHT